MQNQAQQGYVFRRLCQQGTVDLVRQMLEAGAEVDNAQDDGCTGLWLAAEAGNVDVVRLLCAHRASTNIFKNPGNISALFIASQNGHAAVVDVLLLNGANPNTPKTTGASPIFIASQQNFPDVVKSLLRAGANYGAANTQGLAPVHISAYQGNKECLRLLLSAGADPFVAAQGRTAVEWATTNGHRVEVQRVIDDHLKGLENELTKRKVDAFSSGDKSLIGDASAGTLGGGSAGVGGADGSKLGGDHSVSNNRQNNPPEPSGRYLVAAPDTLNSWYTPEFLVKSPPAGARGGGNSFFANQSGGGVIVTDVSVEGFGKRGPNDSSMMSATGGGGSSPDRYSSARSRGNRTGLKHVPHHGSLSLQTIEDEAKRATNFKKMARQGNHLSDKTREIIEGGGSTFSVEKSNPMQMISVEQEWDTYRAQLEASEDYLADTAGEVSDAWMYSAGATQRYADRMKDVRKKQADASHYNKTQEEQSKRSSDNPGFTYPRLPPEAVNKLKGFMAAGRGAAGPPPPLAPEEPSDEAQAPPPPRQYFALSNWQPEPTATPASPVAPASPASPAAGDGGGKKSALSRLKNRKSAA